MSIFRTALAKEIKVQIAERGMTASQVQQRVGMTSANWQRRFGNGARPTDASAEEMAAIAAALGMTGGRLMDLVADRIRSAGPSAQ